MAIVAVGAVTAAVGLVGVLWRWHPLAQQAVGRLAAVDHAHLPRRRCRSSSSSPSSSPWRSTPCRSVAAGSGLPVPRRPHRHPEPLGPPGALACGALVVPVAAVVGGVVAARHGFGGRTGRGGLCVRGHGRRWLSVRPSPSSVVASMLSRRPSAPGSPGAGWQRRESSSWPGSPSSYGAPSRRPQPAPAGEPEPDPGLVGLDRIVAVVGGDRRRSATHRHRP